MAPEWRVLLLEEMQGVIEIAAALPITYIGLDRAGRSPPLHVHPTPGCRQGSMGARLFY